MNFTHTEDRKMMADTLNRYLSKEYTFELRNQYAYTDKGFNKATWQELAGLGIVGALFTEAQGGFGGHGFDISVIFEELGRALVVEPFLPVLMAGHLLHLAGNQKQQELLEQLISGELIISMAHTEPDNYFDQHSVKTSAKLQDGQWVLNGSKAVVYQAEATDQLIISARTAGSTNDANGISLFLVPTASAGLNLHAYQLIDGGRAADLVLNDVVLPADSLIGTEGNAWSNLNQVNQIGALALSAEAVGIMSVIKEATLDYLRERKQFGVPLGSFQALQHRMVEILLEIEQAKSAVINAAAALDSAAAARTVSMAKYSVGRIGIFIAEEAIQLHGGIGMTWELPMAHYAKRLVLIDHILGDKDYHLQNIIDNNLGLAA